LLTAGDRIGWNAIMADTLELEAKQRRRRRGAAITRAGVVGLLLVAPWSPSPWMALRVSLAVLAAAAVYLGHFRRDWLMFLAITGSCGTAIFLDFMAEFPPRGLLTWSLAFVFPVVLGMAIAAMATEPSANRSPSRGSAAPPP
jgi:hypothetical protein